VARRFENSLAYRLVLSHGNLFSFCVQVLFTLLNLI